MVGRMFLVALISVVYGHANANAAESANVDWPQHGRTAGETRFAPSTSINLNNIARLGLTWYHQFDTDRGQEATPIEIGGVLYVSTAWSKIFAFNAVDGALKWAFDPKVPGAAAYKACCDVVNRGVAVSDGRVFIATLDGRLIALDAQSGTPLWSVATVDQTKSYTSTGAPRVVRDKVIIGNSGGEYGTRGYLSAYETRTGKLIWRFFTVPGDPRHGPDGAASDVVMERTEATWSGHWYTYGGGGNVYDSIVYDIELNQLYVGTGNGTPYNYQIRSEGKGDNLFVASILALNPDTGAYLWHYQLNPAESWDWDATQSIILTTLKSQGRNRRVLLQAPKNGFFYVIDRATGRLISAEPYVDQNWATKVDLATGRPIENPNIRFADQPALVSPGTSGAHNWHPMAYDPTKRLAFIPIQRHLTGFYVASKPFEFVRDGWNTGIDFAAASLPDDPEKVKGIAAGMTGALIAWDPATNTARWSVEQPYQRGGGVLATAGNLVFQGRPDGQFKAYAADTGTEVWSYTAGNGIVAAPISYEINHVQYIAVMSGFGGSVIATGFQFPQHQRLPGRLLVFRLDGTAEAAPYTLAPPASPPDVPTTPDTADRSSVIRGAAVFATNCMVCHGVAAIGGTLPDLRYSPFILVRTAYDSVVLGGALQEHGMVSFRDRIAEADLEAIRLYLLSRARQLSEVGSQGDSQNQRATPLSNQ